MSTLPNSYMLDTTFFNDVLDGKVSFVSSPDIRLLITRV